MSIKQEVTHIAEKARKAYLELMLATTEKKNAALKKAAELLVANSSDIMAVNKQDLEAAHKKGLGSALIDRLKIDEKGIEAISKSLNDIITLDDPVGKIIYENVRPNGLVVKRKTIPLGVIGIIYESRPNVTADAWALCLKSGNAALLRPGSESFNTSQKIMSYLKQALKETGLPEDAISMIPTKDREAVAAMLTLDKYIDVIVPRGGRGLIEYVAENSKIPVFKHLDGNCHSYIHKAADKEKAIAVVYNAKMRRTGICGATESIVIDREVAKNILRGLCQKLAESSCEIRGDNEVKEIYADCKDISDEDYATEYLDKIVSVKIVEDINEAIAHINKYSSGHTDAIITEDDKAAKEFLDRVDSAIVMHNSSTQFADGYEFGLGAEIGIATGRMHARGPVGLEQLVTYKYQVFGNGQTRP